MMKQGGSNYGKRQFGRQSKTGSSSNGRATGSKPTLDSLMKGFVVVDDGPKGKRQTLEHEMERYLKGERSLPASMDYGSDTLGPLVKICVGRMIYTYSLAEVYNALKDIRSREDLMDFRKTYPDADAIARIPLVRDELRALEAIYKPAA